MRGMRVPALFGALALFGYSDLVSQQDRVEPAFLQHIPADCDTLLYIGDSLDVVLGVLQSEALEKQLTDGALGELLAGSGADLPNLSGAANAVRLVAEYFPTAICIAAPSESLTSFTEALRCILLLDLMTSAYAVGGETYARALPVLQKDFVNAVETVAGLRATVYVQSREARTAELWFESIVSNLSASEPPAGISLEQRADTLTIVFSPSEIVPPASLAPFLDDYGLINGEQDPMFPELRRVFAELRLTFSFQLVESGLVMSFGESRAGRKSFADLDAHWSGNTDPFVWGAWDIEAFQKGLNAFVETWSQWEDTDVGAVSVEYDEEDFIGTIQTQAQLLSNVPAVGSMGVFVEEDLRATIVSERVPAVHLESSGVFDLIPGDVKILTVNGTQSLGDGAASTLLGIEDRMANEWLKAIVRDDTERLEQIDNLTSQYYEMIGEIRSLVIDESREVFQPPSALIMRNGANMRLRSVDGAPGDFVDLTVPAFAAIGKTGDPERARELIRTLLNEAFSAAGADPSRLNEAFSADLGLGRPTFRLPLSSLNSLGPIHIETPTDAVFHGFVVDDYLVLSTSTELSKSILDKTARFSLPDGAGDLIILHNVDGSEVVETFEDVGDAIVELSHSSLTPGTSPSEAAHAAAKGVSAIGQVLGLIESFTSKTVDDGEQLRTNLRVTFRR